MDRIVLIRAFVTVVNKGSFAAAAQHLAISPQLASKYVLALEADLEVTLLKRSTRQIAITGAGREFYDKAVPLLEEFDGMFAAARKEHVEPQGQLRLSAPMTFGEQYLIDVVHGFMQRHPRITVDLQLTDRYVDLLGDDIDVAIRIGALEDSSLVARKLAPLYQVVCAAPAYLEKHPAPASLEGLSQHHCIVDTNYRSRNDWQLTIDGKRQSVKVSGALSVNSARAAVHAAVLGGGMVCALQIFVRQALASGQLTEVFRDDAFGQESLYAVFNKESHPSAKLRAFIDYLVGAFRAGL